VLTELIVDIGKLREQVAVKLPGHHVQVANPAISIEEM
jgi:hypothetical protein